MATNNIICKVSGTRNQKAIIADAILSNFVASLIYFLLWPTALYCLYKILSFYLMHGSVVTDQTAGVSYIAVAVFLVVVAFKKFVDGSLKQPRKNSLSSAKKRLASNSQVNLFDLVSFDLAKTLSRIISSKELEKVSLSDLLKSVVESKEIGFVLLRSGISGETLTKNVENKAGIASETLIAAIDIAIENGHDSIWSPDLLLAISAVSPKLRSLWQDFGIEEADIKSIVGWQTNVLESARRESGIFNPINLKKTGGIGREWAYGYTNFLRQFSVNLTETIESNGLNLEVIGRDKEIGQINEALSKQSNANVLLVGNAGVGKRATVLGFAKKMIEGDSANNIRHNNIFQVDTDAIISGAHNEGEIVQRVAQILDEATYAGDVIILIENIDRLFSAEGVGTADLSAVILPHLENTSVHIIGTCEIDPYNKYILSNSSLTNHFSRVSIEEPSPEDLIKILEDTAPIIEGKTGSIVTYESLKEVIKKSAKYIANSTEPERSISLLEGAATHATSERGKTLVLDKDVDDFLSEKINIPTGQASEDEKKKLLDLEKIMHEMVIGQDEAIKAVAGAMRRARAQVSETTKPIGSFLFLGPTGVGKTATAKALAKAYFGGSDKMIRFDMSEYQNKVDLYRLIGTKDEPGNLTKAVSENPFSLLLFDEIEKADPDILNIFLQILDEGHITDGRDQKIMFSDTIIIATSNAGSALISQLIETGQDYASIKSELDNYLAEENIFKPELINRFTEVVAFSPLSQDAIKQIAGLLATNVSKNIFEKQGITLSFAADAIALLASAGYDPKMGARPMERVMSDKVENLLAEKILRNELKKGDRLTITKEMVG